MSAGKVQQNRCLLGVPLHHYRLMSVTQQSEEPEIKEQTVTKCCSCSGNFAALHVGIKRLSGFLATLWFKTSSFLSFIPKQMDLRQIRRWGICFQTCKKKKQEICSKKEQSTYRRLVCSLLQQQHFENMKPQHGLVLVFSLLHFHPPVCARVPRNSPFSALSSGRGACHPAAEQRRPTVPPSCVCASSWSSAIPSRCPPAPAESRSRTGKQPAWQKQ